MNDKFIIKICAILFIGIIAFSNFSIIYATSEEDKEEYKGFFGEIFGQGSSFFNPTTEPTGDEIGIEINNQIKNLGIIDAIFDVGNLIFVIITSVLGLKYIFANSNEKADIKNSLITLCVAIVFFFLAQNVYDFTSGAMKDALSGNSYESLAQSLWATISSIINICAILGVILVGLRYMFAPANTRADIKTELVPVVIGIIFVYCSVNIINFVINVFSGALVTG